MSVIVLQARGGRRMLRREPRRDEDWRSTRSSRPMSRRSCESGQLLGCSAGRQTSDATLSSAAPGLAPSRRAGRQRYLQPGLLVEVARRRRLPVELPPSLDVSAYRIVQEALTNALKHAGPASAEVAVRYGHDVLELEVVDNGSGNGNGDGSGHGLVGIRERVGVYGGRARGRPPTPVTASAPGARPPFVGGSR